MDKIYRVAVIGCGAIGGRNDSLRGWTQGQPALSHAGAYRSHPRTDLVAAADPDLARRDEFARAWKVPSLYTDFRQLLDRESPDLVSICAPTPLHVPIMEEAVRRGVPALFCEKPLAWDLAAAVRACGEAVEGGTLLAVNYSRRWNVSLRDLAAQLREGACGEVRRVSVWYPGGIVGNGTHALDLIRWMVGDIAEAQALGRCDPEAPDPALDALCRTECGVPCLLQSCDPRAYSLLELDILTSTGRIRVTGNGRRIERTHAAPDSHFPGYRVLQADGDVRATAWETCLPRAVDDLVSCLDTGARPQCGGEEAIEALRAATAICRSAQAGGRPVALSSLPVERPAAVKPRGAC